MDDVMNRIAKELSDAIAAAVAEDARVEACREKARAAGFELKISLEAIIGYISRNQPGALARVQPQQKALAKQDDPLGLILRQAHFDLGASLPPRGGASPSG